MSSVCTKRITAKLIGIVLPECPRCGTLADPEVLRDDTPNEANVTHIKITCRTCEFSTGWDEDYRVDWFWRSGTPAPHANTQHKLPEVLYSLIGDDDGPTWGNLSGWEPTEVVSRMTQTCEIHNEVLDVMLVERQGVTWIVAGHWNDGPLKETD